MGRFTLTLSVPTFSGVSYKTRGPIAAIYSTTFEAHTAFITLERRFDLLIVVVRGPTMLPLTLPGTTSIVLKMHLVSCMTGASGINNLQV
jgi:hypothetical protein